MDADSSSATQLESSKVEPRFSDPPMRAQWASRSAQVCPCAWRDVTGHDESAAARWNVQRAVIAQLSAMEAFMPHLLSSRCSVAQRVSKRVAVCGAFQDHS